MIKTVLNLLRSDAYITVNKNLARNIGLAPATVFSELAAKLNYFSDRGEMKNGYFYCTIADLEKNTGLSKDEQYTAMKRLVRYGLIEKKIMKMKGDEAPKRYFKITDDVGVLAKYLTDHDSDSENIEKTGFEEIPKSTLGNSEIEVRNFLNQTPFQAYNEPSSRLLNKNKEKEYINENKKTTHTYLSEHNNYTGKNVCRNHQKEDIYLDGLREEAEKIIGEKLWKDKFNTVMKMLQSQSLDNT